MRTKTRTPQEERYMVPVVRSTFRILEELSESGTLRLSEISHRTGLAKSTVFRVLRSLDSLGYVLRDPEQREYALSPNLAELARPVAWSEPLRRISLPYMLELRQKFGETVNLGEIKLDRVVYLEVLPSEHALSVNERKGDWVYAHTSALGKAILAFSVPELVATIVSHRSLPALTPNTITDPRRFQEELERVRQQGYATDMQETNMLACCVAAPILDKHGIAIAAISISGAAVRFDPNSRAVQRALMRATQRISRHFGWEPAPLRRGKSRAGVSVPAA